MRKWVVRITVILVLLSVGGYEAYHYFARGYHTRPALPDGAFSLSFKNGLRAIILDVPEERATRRYFGVPFDVPFWAEEAWSYCRPPTNKQASEITAEIDFFGAGSRLDAVCTVEADNHTMTRGAIFSVPKL
jgi:hypothetical protein